jgi:hypothetical protein
MKLIMRSASVRIGLSDPAGASAEGVTASASAFAVFDRHAKRNVDGDVDELIGSDGVTVEMGVELDRD